jgi:acyl-CoA dehydrogenase
MSATPHSEANRVLQPDFRVSKNFYHSDRILRDYLGRHLSPADLAAFAGRLELLGQAAAQEMDAYSLNADKFPPTLAKRDRYGETVDEIRFHPDYWRLMEIAVQSHMFHLKWDPRQRQETQGRRHTLGFALGYLYAMSESGQYCPLCMTDGVALLIDRFCSQEDRDRLLPRIASADARTFATGAMFLTEKAGGSDVGANVVRAVQQAGRRYTLHGEKWFCSNANADIIFVLARTRPEIPGTRGLSIFLVEKLLPDGSRNPLGMVRLKDKLGVRSMASAECILDGTVGTLVGEEGQGFQIMTEMINLSRLYNSMAALAGGRRALVEAWQFLSFRTTFGKQAVSHSLVRAKFQELASLNLANFHLVWRAIRAMDAAERGDAAAATLLRLLTPMVKRSSAELAVYLARESMELMGGLGYIEETVMPKLMRDMMVLPIWEGAGNIMVLDMLRASRKSDGLQLLLAEIERIVGTHPLGARITEEAGTLARRLFELEGQPQDLVEYQCKQLFLDLTHCYQTALIISEAGDSVAGALALDYLRKADRSVPPSTEELAQLIGWEF